MEVDLVMTFENSVNKEKFKKLALKLRQTYQFYRLCLYFDNLSVYRSFEIRQYLENQLRMSYIFCPPLVQTLMESRASSQFTKIV